MEGDVGRISQEVDDTFKKWQKSKKKSGQNLHKVGKKLKIWIKDPKNGHNL